VLFRLYLLVFHQLNKFDKNSEYEMNNVNIIILVISSQVLINFIFQRRSIPAARQLSFNYKLHKTEEESFSHSSYFQILFFLFDFPFYFPTAITSAMPGGAPIISPRLVILMYLTVSGKSGKLYNDAPAFIGVL
jgi:hypothetical protein